MRDANLSEQTLCFLWSIAAGLILGLVYSSLFILRSIKPKSRILTISADVLFMVIFAFITVIFSIGFTDGVTRYYVVIGELMGFFMFRITLGRLIREAVSRIFVFFGKFRVFFQKNISVISKKLLKARDKMLYNIEKKNHRSMISRKGE